MGFFDFLGNIVDGLNNFCSSESMQNAMGSLADSAIKKAEQAERDYDAGRISFEEYMKAVENASNTIGSYSKYQDSIQRMKNKR